MTSRPVALLPLLIALVGLVVLVRQAGGFEREESVEAGEAIEIGGTVISPKGTPADEQVEVVLSVALESDDDSRYAFEDTWREVDRVAVATDGSFRLSLPEDAPKARVDVDARYLFLPWPVALETPHEAAPLRLEPRLGGVLFLRFLASPGSAFDARDIVGRRLRVGHTPRGRSSTGFSSIPATVGEDLTVELRGLDPADDFDVHGDLSPFAPPRHRGIRVRPGRRTEVLIELVDGRVIGGVVIDQAGNPLEGARLAIECSHGREGERGSTTFYEESDAEGRFLRTGVFPAVHSISARHDGFLTGRLTAEEIGTEPERRDLRLVLGRGDSIEGTVRLEDGRPVAGAEVHCRRATREGEYLRGASFTTDDEGRFRATGLTAGYYALDASGWFDGAALATEHAVARVVARDGEGIEWTATPSLATQGTVDLELHLVAPPGIEGVVVDTSGAPILEFRVEAESARESRFSSFDRGILSADHVKRFESSDGRFRWEELQAGDWRVGVRASGYLAARPVHVELPGDEEPLRFVLQAGATIAGIVRDPAGNLVERARVTPSLITGRGRMTNMNLSRSSDEGGRFELTGLRGGEYELIARSDGLAPNVPVVVDLSPGLGVSDVEVRLTAGGTLSIDVLGPEGAPEPFAGVVASGSVMQAGQSGEADDEGHLELGPLFAGEYRVSARGEGEGKELLFGKVRVVDGETVHLTLGGPKTVAVVVDGRVTAGGKPIFGALVHARPTEHWDAGETIETGADGRFSLGLIGGGHVLFRVYGEGRGRYLTFEETVPAEGTFPVAFDLPTGGLRGTVTREGEGELPFHLQVLVERVREEGTAWAGGDLDVLRVGKSGRWSCLYLEPGHYRIVAAVDPRLGGFDENSLAIAVIEDIFVESWRVIEGVDLKLGPSGTIAGTVRGHDGRSIAEALLCVRDSTGRLFHPDCPAVGAGGGFSLTGLPAGRVTIEAFGEHLATPVPLPLEVKAGEVVQQDLELVPATVVTVELGGWKGDASGIVLRLRDSAGREHAGERGRGAGKLHAPHLLARRFGPLPPGRWLAGVTLPDGREVETAFELAGERERTVVLECGR